MKNFTLVALALTIFSFSTAIAQSCYQNPSLEGPSQAHVVPAPWQSCYGSPDTQPGQWGIVLPPSHGNSYVSFLHSGQSPNGYNEGMTQLLNPCLQAGTQYSFTVDLAHTLVYNTASPNGCYSSLAVFGGNTACAQAETLWTSGQFTHTNWQTYTVTFTPNGNWCYLSFSPYYITACGGYINVLMDNISCVAPSAIVDVTDVSCNGVCDGIAIAEPTNGTPPFTYAWSPGVWPNNDTITGLCAGNYTLVLTDASQQQYTYQFVVNEPPVLVTNATFTNPSCNGVLDGTTTSNTVGGTAPYTYNWLPGNVNTPNLSGLGSGQYIVNVTDTNGCTAADTVTLVEPTPVTVTSSDILVCVSQNGILTANAGGGNGAPYTYVWDNGNFIGNPYNMGSVNQVSTHTVVAVDANGCISAPFQVTVTPGAPLTVATTPVSICNGESTTMVALPGGGDGNYNIVWAPGGGQGDSVVVSPNTTTTYTVTVTDGCGTPAANNTLTVTVNEIPVSAFSGDPRAGCSPVCTDFTDVSTVNNATIVGWNWTFENGGTSNQQNPTVCFQGAGSYDVTLEVTSNFGCKNTVTIPDYITVFPDPMACFKSSPNPTTISKPTVNFEFCGTSNNPSVYVWDFGTGQGPVSGGAGASHVYPDTGKYYVSLHLTNVYGCVDSTSGIVTILPDFTFFVPNSFSPNEDGINEIFYAYGSYVREFEMTIYDRWGENVYYTNKLDVGWNGKIKGASENAKEDVYLYKIKVISDLGDEYSYTGQVNLLR